MIKNGGTTLKYIFRNNYGFNCFENDADIFKPDDLRYLLKINRNMSVISGHAFRSVNKLESVCSNIKYITLLRNPIDRYISHYNHGRSKDYHSMPIRERLKLAGERNYQTKFIIGKKNFKERSFIASEKELEKAKKILNEHFIFVGLVEEFDLSLILMKKMLNFDSFELFYQKRNVTSKKFVSKKSISDEVLSDIKDANRLDFQLYDFVRDNIFKEQIRKYDRDYKKTLEDFKRANENYIFNRAKIIQYRIGKYIIYGPMFKIRSNFLAMKG